MKPLPITREDLIELVEQHFSCRMGAPRNRASSRAGYGKNARSTVDPFLYRVLVWRKRYKVPANGVVPPDTYHELHARMWDSFDALWRTCTPRRPVLYWRFDSKIRDESYGTFVQVYTRVAIPAAKWPHTQIFDSTQISEANYV